MSKYAPLRRYLEGIHADEVTLSFADIEEIIESDLPKSAHDYDAWWANDSNGKHVHANEWMNAGWKTSRVSLGEERVTFTRE